MAEQQKHQDKQSEQQRQQGAQQHQQSGQHQSGQHQQSGDQQRQQGGQQGGEQRQQQQDGGRQGQQLGQVPQQLAEAGRQLQNDARQLQRSVSSAGTELQSFLSEQARNRPLGVLAAAAGVGYLLGGGISSRLTILALGAGTRFAMAMAAREMGNWAQGSMSGQSSHEPPTPTRH